jgi:hypothetical protein
MLENKLHSVAHETVTIIKQVHDFWPMKWDAEILYRATESLF